MKTFLLDYKTPDGRSFSASIQASSYEEAEQHAAALKTTATLIGECVHTAQFKINRR